MPVFHRQRRLLRTAVLVLLVLGMAISPIFGAVGDLHGVQHAAVAEHHPDGHDHPHAPQAHRHSDGHHGGGDHGDPAADHATGTHGLMHQASHVSVTLPDIALDIAAPPPSDQLLPEFARRQLPGDSPDLPFRPPIA